ncbi:phytoene desaturase family protein [Halarcobacter ebronensis]|uniref:Carotene isomerase n=1 Tax=Halarcobacter ebronensis TaxID=1462615 RepID=A0A4Q1APV2_9BACT|nr:NAD(P)-binding protein [Halarcobacter ebronensis]QKF82696.1 phytoene dehydrogenase-related protein [Halarcobacter ebronensis]RXK06722.1 carotene isomerase [Halarcobacter ebronensis]
MKLHDLAIVGSGMGGSMLASLNKEKDVVLFEKDKNLGGCASTFKRFGSYYNAGATTFVGYEDKHIVKEIFDKALYIPDILESSVAIRVLQKDKIIDRVRDFEHFLEQINRAFPNKNNREFWQKIKELDERFWSLKKLYYAKYSLGSYIKSLNSFMVLLYKFKIDIFKSAKSFIKEVLGEISKEYKEFIDAQLLITLQTTSKDISVLSLALGLAYPFHKVFYVNGGMGSLFENLLKDINLKRKEQILKIIKEEDSYRVISDKDEYLSKNIVLNSSIYNCSELFDNKKIRNYYQDFHFSNQSAFVINFNLNCNEEFFHHYQIILDKEIPNSISKSFFISISDKNDKKMSNKGLSVTISTHSKASFWENINTQEYEKQKNITQEFIINAFLEHFETIKKEDIINISSATAKTFKRYINRSNCGGRPITLSNILQIPSCKTPFKGLYNIGDTVFAGQGWPGVAIGVKILNEEING